MGQTRDELLIEMFLTYWKYPVKPTFRNPDNSDKSDDSVEGLILAVYESQKNQALMKYPWRSAQKYVTLDAPQANDLDGRYKYKFDLPTDFLAQNGFWRDSGRHDGIQNEVDIVGRIAKTNRSAFTMQYTATMEGEEELLDTWVVQWVELFIAAECADIGGIDPTQKNFLIQKVQFDEGTLQNKDFEMSQKDETLGNQDQFLKDWY